MLATYHHPPIRSLGLMTSEYDCKEECMTYLSIYMHCGAVIKKHSVCDVGEYFECKKRGVTLYSRVISHAILIVQVAINWSHELLDTHTHTLVSVPATLRKEGLVPRPHTHTHT